jgi:hypothetical protein
MTPQPPAGQRTRWGLAVWWGSTRGAVAFRDPVSGERVEVEARWLRSTNPRTDLGWMLRRARRTERMEGTG